MAAVPSVFLNNLHQAQRLHYVEEFTVFGPPHQRVHTCAISIMNVLDPQLKQIHLSAQSEGGPANLFLASDSTRQAAKEQAAFNALMALGFAPDAVNFQPAAGTGGNGEGNA